MITPRPLSQKRINLIDKYDGWLSFPRQTEQTGHKLVRFSVPFVSEHRCGNVDESSARLPRESFGEHGLSAPWRTEKKDALWGSKERGRRSKDFWILQWIYHRLSEIRDDGVQSTNVLKVL